MIVKIASVIHHPSPPVQPVNKATRQAVGGAMAQQKIKAALRNGGAIGHQPHHPGMSVNIDLPRLNHDAPGCVQVRLSIRRKTFDKTAGGIAAC